MGQILRQPYYWALTGLFILAIGVNQGLFHMLSLYMTVERGMDPGHGNHLIALSRVIAFAVPLLVGYLLDRFGTMPVLRTSILASGLALLFMAWVPTPYIWLGLIFQAMTSVVFFPVGFAAMSQVTTARTRNLMVSLTIPPAYLLGGGAVPAGIGMLAEAGRFSLGAYHTGRPHPLRPCPGLLPEAGAEFAAGRPRMLKGRHHPLHAAAPGLARAAVCIWPAAPETASATRV